MELDQSYLRITGYMFQNKSHGIMFLTVKLLIKTIFQVEQIGNWNIGDIVYCKNSSSKSKTFWNYNKVIKDNFVVSTVFASYLIRYKNYLIK